MLKKTKIIKEILWTLYYNGDEPLDQIRRIGGTYRPKKIIQTNIDKMLCEGWIEKKWYSSIPAFRNEKYKEIHYGLTYMGHDIADNLPNIVTERREKEIEYELDAYENELRNR